MKAPSPLLGFNNNVRHRGRVFHIQTEDSGIKHPHIITHLFADGGRILKTIKTSYAEHLGQERLAETVRGMMQEQHKAMFIALRDGQYDQLIDAANPRASRANLDALGPDGKKLVPPAAPSAPNASTTATAGATAPADAPKPAAALSAPAAPAAPIAPAATAALVTSDATPAASAASEVSAPLAPIPAPSPAPPAVAPAAPAAKRSSARPPAPPPVSVSHAPSSGPGTAPTSSRRRGEIDPSSVSPVTPRDDGRRASLRATPSQRIDLGPRSSGPSSEPGPSSSVPSSGRRSGRPTLDVDPSAIHRAGTGGRAWDASSINGGITGIDGDARKASVDVSGVSGAPASGPVSGPDVDLDALERAAAESQGQVYQQIQNLPPPPAAVLVGKRGTGSYSSRTPLPPPVARRVFTPGGRPAIPSPNRYAPSRPASIFSTSRPPEGGSIFGEDLISEKSLDEVILSYLAEDLEGPGEKK